MAGSSSQYSSHQIIRHQSFPFLLFFPCVSSSSVLPSSLFAFSVFDDQSFLAVFFLLISLCSSSSILAQSISTVFIFDNQSFYPNPSGAFPSWSTPSSTSPSSLSLPTLARGTVDLVLVTSYNNILPILSVPFGKLTEVSPFQRGAGIYVSTGTNVPISDSEINCQCFQDVVGTKTLGDSFTNIIPGTSLPDEQPVQIGSIFCSDAAGVKS